MQASMTPFLPLLGASTVQYVIPVYQRKYAWEETDCQVLWEDILRAGRNNKPHFVGSVLHIPEGDENVTGMKKRLLIDGQQRMTTLTLLLEAFVEHLEADESRASFLTDIKVSGLRKSYLFNDDDYNGNARYKLVLSQEDRPTLFAVVGRTALPKGPSEQLIENLNFFRKRMAGASFNAKMLWNGLCQLQVIDTQLTAGVDDAQLIFESMNSKGRPLSATDLIRNYVLMSLREEKQTRLYETYWTPIEATFKPAGNPDAEFNAFMWYWLWIRIPERKPSEDEVYAEFKYFTRDVYGGSTEDLLKELLVYTARYADLFLGMEESSILSSAFADINGLGVRQIRPVLMVLYGLFDEGKITESSFLSICRTFESFLFRRAVCGRLTTGLNHFFAGVYRDINKQADIETYINAMLLTHTYHMTAYFPTDDHFKEQLESRDCYNRFTKRSYLLERLENSYHPKQPISVGQQYQIEHVMPQSIGSSQEWQDTLGPDWEEIHDQYCNTIGNLTITGYNPELSNRSFSEKLNDEECGFKSSPYSLNSYIRTQTHWGVEQIKKRAENLAVQAVKVWSYPHVDAAIVESHRPKKGKQGSIDWTIEEHHAWMAEGGPCHGLFEALTSRIELEHPDWEMYVAKYYVGFRTGKRSLHFAVIDRFSGGNGRLALCLTKSVDDLIDPKVLCSDKRSAGGIGPGCPTFANFANVSELDNVMALINQC